jgi:hypothetical protein
MAAAKKSSKFDLSALQKMKEPVRIRIARKDRLTGGRLQPIPLPLEEWSLADAAKIEDIVLNDIAGGGTFEAQVTDAAGASMQWEFHFPLDYFPPKMPGSMAGAAMQPSNGANGQQPQSTAPPTGWYPGLYGTPQPLPQQPTPPSYATRQQQQQPHPQGLPHQYWGPQYGMPPYTPPPPYYNPYGYQTPPVSTSRTGGNDPKVDQLQRQLEELRAEKLRGDYERSLARQQAQHREELAALKSGFENQLRELKEALVDKTRRNDDDPALLALRQQNETITKQFEAEKQARERAEADARHREEMRQLRESSDRQVESLKLMMEKMNEGRIDPTMQMLVELQRQQSDAQKEAARLSAEQARESSRLASEQPRMVMELMERAHNTNGTERIMHQLATAYQGSNEMYKGAVEMLLNMQGSPGWDMAGNALESGKQILEQYVKGKRDEAVASQQTEQMRAQAQAASAYAAAQPQPQPEQDPYRYEDGSIKGQAPPRTALPAEDAEIVDGEADAEEPNPEIGEVHGGVKEAQLFGLIWDNVQEVRQAVANGQVDPGQVGQAIVEAAVQIESAGVAVPVFELYRERRYADLMDLVLPAASSEFNAACVMVIESLRQQIETGVSEPVVPDVANPMATAPPPDPDIETSAVEVVPAN